jgi:quinol monooxygenase YgiN
MITVLFYTTIKAGREAEAARVAVETTKSTRAEDRGCISYTFLRRSDNPREFVLNEQWQDQDALNAHIARLQRVFGPPNDQEPHPPAHHRRRLPKALLDLFEKTDAVRYDALE